MSRASIYDSSIDSLLSKILLLRSRNKSLTLIYVEGNTDFDYFYNFFDKSKCSIVGCKGKNSVIQVIKKANARFSKGIVGILDKDYDQLLGHLLSVPNLFYTDEHDMECMIFKTDIFDRLINKYTDSQKCLELNIPEDKIKTEIISNAKQIGSIRRFNELNDLRIDFKKFNFEDCFDDELIFDISKIIETILRAYKFQDPIEIEEQLNKEKNTDYETWQICRGHDISELIKIIFTRDEHPNIGNDKSQKEINTTERIEDIIQLAYGGDEFKKTELYSKLEQWELANPGYSILKE